jgi:KUP system potassium uptake protein
VTRVPGTAVFLTHNPDNVPHAMLHSLKHYKALHERVVLVSVNILDIPRRGAKPQAGRGAPGRVTSGR